MENNKLFFVLAALCLILDMILGAGIFSKTEVEYVDKPIITEKIVYVNDTVDPVDSYIEKLCELTDGCKYYKINESEADTLDDIVYGEEEEFEEEFVEEFADFVGIDEDYLNITDIDKKDKKVIAYTEEDKEEGNYYVQIFYRVKYKDRDTDDKLVKYIVVDSLLDKGEFDSLSIKEVERTFEFD